VCEIFLGHRWVQFWAWIAPARPNGDNVRVIAEEMGSSIAMIDLTYSHVPRKVEQAAADRLAGMLYGT